jgi:hypothetical protein
VCGSHFNPLFVQAVQLSLLAATHRFFVAWQYEQLTFFDSTWYMAARNNIKKGVDQPQLRTQDTRSAVLLFLHS